MRKSSLSKKEITIIFLVVLVVVFLVKNSLVFNGEQLEGIVYKSKNLIVQKLEKGQERNCEKTLVVLGNGWNVSVDNKDKVTEHDPFFAIPKEEVRLLKGKSYEILTAYFPFECQGIDQTGQELAQFINHNYGGYKVIMIGHSKSGVCFANLSKWLEANGEDAIVVTVSAPYGGVKSDEENLQKLNALEQWLYPKIIVSHRTNDDITKDSSFLLETADFTGLSTREFYNIRSVLLENSYAYDQSILIFRWIDNKFNVNGDGVVGFKEQQAPIQEKSEFIIGASHQSSMINAIKLLKKEGIL